jgi:anaerobic magnesium-protoporphyrin IX monomethyl ester cyclase
VGYWGPQSKKNVDFGFDANRSKEATIAAASDDAVWSTMHFRKMERKAARAAQKQQAAAFKACGGGTEQLEEEQPAVAETVN